MQLTRNFMLEEFRCPDGCGGEILVTARLLAALQRLRDACGVPIQVKSGFRCLDYNRSIGSEDTSQHVRGMAADIVVSRVATRQAYPLEWLRQRALGIKEFERGGIGLYDTFIHVDVRETGPARWDERDKTLPF